MQNFSLQNLAVFSSPFTYPVSSFVPPSEATQCTFIQQDGQSSPFYADIIAGKVGEGDEGNRESPLMVQQPTKRPGSGKRTRALSLKLPKAVENDQPVSVVSGQLQIKYGVKTMMVGQDGLQNLPGHQGAKMRYDDFEFVRSAGGGASGTVRIVRHKPTNRNYAEKEITLQGSYDEIAKMLASELAVILDAERFNSHYIVPSYEVFYVDGGVRIIMEHMNCGSLKDLLEKIPDRKVPPVPLRGLLHQLFSGLEFLHSGKASPQLHRDIKPGNLLINSEGEAKIADFGCLRSLESCGVAETFLGTRVYMSPERLDGRTYDAAADIWSMGLVAAECALGSYPLGDASKSMMDIIHAAERGLSEASLLLIGDPHLRDLIQTCLNTTPKDRPQAGTLLQWHPYFSVIGGGTASQMDRERAVSDLGNWIQEMGRGCGGET